jgi:hypothetical protein
MAPPPPTSSANKRKKSSSGGNAAAKKAKPATGAATDFKRIKAKVGKRAIKPANVTDTTFKSTSIHVRAQTVETTTTTTTSTIAAAADGFGSSSSHLFLTSSRGKTLQELALQLQHPAPNVRLSAAKGLYDAVLVATTTTTTTTGSTVNATGASAAAAAAAARPPAHYSAVIIQAHLAILIPAIGQCLLDEETDAVRRLGLNILQQVLRTLSDDHENDNHRSSTASTSTLTTASSNTTRALRPFASLLLAFLSLCLNSLDRDVRKDGAMAIAAVARATPILVAPQAANSLLPAIVRLFEDAVLVRQTSASASSAHAAGAAVNSSSSSKNKNSNGARREKVGVAVVGKQRQGKNKSSSSSSSSKSSSSSSSSTWHFLLQCLLAVLQTLDADDCNKIHAAAGSNKKNSSASMVLGGGEPDWIFETGGQAKNALLVVPGPEKAGAAAVAVARRRLYPMRSLPDVTLALGQLYSSSSSSSSTTAGASAAGSTYTTTKMSTRLRLSEKTARQLLEKLRDVFIELTDNINNNINMTNNHMIAANLDSFLLLSKCLRLLVEQLASTLTLTEESSRRVMMQLNGFIMELFPLQHISVSNDSSSRSSSSMAAAVNEINGQLCLTLMSMSAVIQANDEKTASMWQGKVFDYVQSSLVDLDLSTASSGSSSSSKHVLDGFRRLFYYCHNAASSGNGNDDDDDNNIKSSLLAKKQAVLIKTFAKSFFPDSSSSSLHNLEAARRSFTGRQSVDLASMIFCTHNFELYGLQAALGIDKEDVTIRIVQGLVDYFIAFRGDYPMESEVILRLLHALMIRVSKDDTNISIAGNEEEKSQDLCANLRQRLEPIFAPCNATNEGTNNNSLLACIFELYPDHLQRLVIGLVVTLGPPSKSTLSALARVCGRANSTSSKMCSTTTAGESAAASGTASPRRPTVISADVAAFIIHSMHIIRQSLAMSDFLTFLVDSMGIIQVNETTLAVTTTTAIKTETSNKNSGSNTQEDAVQNDMFQRLARLVQYDRVVKDVSFCLVGCGSKKVLSMLHPLLSRWLDEPAKDVMAKIPRRPAAKHQKELLQSRTALTLLAMLSLDLNADDSCSTSIFDCPAVETFESTVAKSIVRLLQYTPTETASENEYTILHYWTSPIISLIASESDLLSRVFQCIADSLNTAMDEESATHHHQKTMMALQSLLWLCKRPQIVEVLQHPNQTLLQHTSRMETAVADGPLERLVGHIVATVELHAQQPPRQK